MRNVVIGREGRVSVNSRDAFHYYKATSRLRHKENTPTFEVYRKIVHAFYNKVSEKLVDGDSGVFLKTFGYFSIIAHPKKQVVKVPYQNQKEYFNFKTNNLLYMPMFFPIAKGKPLLSLWVMDRTFMRSAIKSRLHKMLISGKKYKTYIATLYSLYATKF